MAKSVSEMITEEDQDLIRWILADTDSTLNDREKRVIGARFMCEPSLTLRKLADEFGLKSHERVRQIQNVALSKIRHRIRFVKKFGRDYPVEVKPIRNGSVKKKQLKPKLDREHARWAKQTIGALKAFLRGEPLQWKCSFTRYQWQDFDLAQELNGVKQEWRPKPVLTSKKERNAVPVS